VPVSADPVLRRRAQLLLAVFSLASLILLALPLPVKVVLADRLTAVLTAPYARSIAFLAETARVHRQNLELRAEVTALRLDAASCLRYRRQRDELRYALGLVESSGAMLVPCEIDRRRLDPRATLVRIRSAEVVPWQRYLPVVTRDGLIGRVRQATGPNTAWVELLTSPGSAVSCEIARNGIVGILEFRERRFLLTMVGRDEDVRPGDLVVTSSIVASLPGLGIETGRWPAGLPVGTVASVSEGENPLFKEIVVRPAASFGAPGVVFVVLGRGDWFNGSGEAAP